MGAGGVGGYFGALLARAGHEVTFVARGAHLAGQYGLCASKARSMGLLCVRPGGKPYDPGRLQESGVIYGQDAHNAAALAAVQPLLGDDTIVLTLQNGIDNGTQLVALYGAAWIMIG